MKKLFLIILIALNASCTTNKTIDTQRSNLPSPSHNEFKDITNDKYVARVNKDTISITQIKYNYVFTEFLLKKIMFDKFGKWDESRYKENERHPVLVWNQVKLFPNRDNLYMVAATGGGEAEQKIYSSVMIFDQQGNDLLAINPELRNDVTEYFTELIHQNDNNKKEFYSVYWKEVDPKFYKKYIK